MRSVHLPNFNDHELLELASILGDMGVDEHFIQPCSVYNLKELKSIGFDVERATFTIKVVEECCEFVKAVIPG